MTKDRTKAMPHINNSIKTFSCWKCTKKFEFAEQRVNHFINEHAAPIRSKIIELSINATDDNAVVKNQINDAKTTMNYMKPSFSCLECTKKLESDGGLISHFIDKHAKFILFMETDPSNILQNQITMAQERLATAQKTAITEAVSK
jgi:uncharacterized protein YlaI